MNSKKREVCFLIGEGERLLYADSSNSATAISDSAKRWKRIWNLRHELVEISHSHPISAAEFSQEDETTMKALLAALGKNIRFSVVSAKATKVRNGTQEYFLEQEPWWVDLLRSASGFEKQ